jgi:AhpD family alkylhydroperoxidase
MTTQAAGISEAFRMFQTEAPQHAAAWGTMVQSVAAASALDAKTSSLAYLAVLAAKGMTSGVPFHVQLAKRAGATREEVISALLVGLPAVGHGVTQALPPALAAWDAA